jgi:Na+/H+ antiporter NhaA
MPKDWKVLAFKGDRNMFELHGGPAKVSITAMFVFSACGGMCPPMVIYLYQRILSEITKKVSDDWGVDHSTTRWITAELYYECFGHVFTPLLGKHMSSSLLSFLSLTIAPI